MGLLESLQRRIHKSAVDWPPGDVREHWDKVRQWKLRFENDRDKLLMYNETFSGSFDQAQLYTPVPLTTEMARLSAALMFSKSPTIQHDSYQDDLEEFRTVNGLDPRLQEIAEHISVEGRGAFRVSWDDDIAEGRVPVFSYIHEDQILWDEKHSWFVLGGTVVIERETDDGAGGAIYRLLEEHTPGFVQRTMYKGDTVRLGREIPLNDEAVVDLFPDYEGVPVEEVTGLTTPTLIRWDNVPGGRSDIQGLELILDRLDEAESLLLDKGRKSVPVTLADEAMIEDKGRISFPGVVFLKSGGLLPSDDSPFVETIQPGFDVAPHLEWIRHIRESVVMYAGYSLASWGLDNTFAADSGKALKLRQARTLLTKAGKDRMAIEAIRTAIATALAMMNGASEIKPFKPDLELGDGLPEDAIENAQQIQLEDSAGAVSLKQKVRLIRPDWTDSQVNREVADIQADQKKQLLLESMQSGAFGPPPPGKQGARGVSGDSTSGPARTDQTQ